MTRPTTHTRVHIDTETTDETAAAEALAHMRRDRFRGLPIGGALCAHQLWLLGGDPARPHAVIEILSNGRQSLALHPLRMTETGELTAAPYLSVPLPTAALDTAADPVAIRRLATAISRSHKALTGEG